MNRTTRGWADALKELLPDIATMLLVVAAYLPAFQAGFIWDDGAHVTQNPYVTGALGFRGIWTTSAATYYPLVLTSFWIQNAIWGLNPFPYHVVNVVVHGICAVLLRRVLLNLNAGSAAAWLGAVLWAVHPVQVESVAWITELKNTQSCAFYLVAILFFFKWRSRPESAKSRYIFYSLFLLSFACALLSKTSTVMLPVVLVLCAWWLDRGWNWKTLRGLVPLFALSAIAAGWTIWEQRYHSGARGAAWLQSFPERLAIAGKCIWFYFGKLLWPHPLIFMYPRWTINPADLLSFLPILAAAAALAVCWWFRERWGRAPFFAAAYFVVSLFPVLDFFNVYFFRYSFVGDHFQYLASMGPLALAGAGIVRAFDAKKIQAKWKVNRWILAGVSCALIAILVTWTSAHTEVFQNDEKLWAHTIADNPDAWLAHDNLAAIYLGRDNLLDAISQLEITLKLQPDYAEGQANLAMALYESGDIDEAIRHFRLSLQQTPSFTPGQILVLRERTHNYLGEALMSKGTLDEAIDEIDKAVAISPHDAGAQENLAIALARSGKVAEALPHYGEAVQDAPESVDHRMNYGKALLFQTQDAAAAAQFSAVLDLDPVSQQAHKYLGITLSALHRYDEALPHLMEAVRLDPHDTEAMQKLEEAKSAQARRSR